MGASWKTVPDLGRSQQAGRSGNAAFLLLRWTNSFCVATPHLALPRALTLCVFCRPSL